MRRRDDARFDTDVVVIGAGVAGLEAARRLGLARWRTIILEARPRVGGRIETHRLAGWPGPVEAGAEFVHGLPPASMRVLRTARARLVEVRARHDLLRRGRAVRADRAWRAALRRLGELPDEDVAFSALLRRRGTTRGLSRDAVAMLRGFVEGFNAADATLLSVKGLNRQTEASEDEQGDRLFRVRDGYDALPLALERSLRNAEMRLATIATRVAWRPHDGVTVATHAALGGARAAVRARAAIITVPLAVLRARPPAAGAIRFEPALPAAKREAIAKLAMGTVLKVAVRLRERSAGGAFDRLPSGWTFLHAPDEPVPTWWIPAPQDRCLVGWVAGPAADRFLRRAPPDPRRRAVVALSGLARALGTRPDRLLAAIEDVRVFDWAADPFTRGAYSWIPVGALAAPAALAQPVGACLFFAGEATDVAGDPGTVHGALATGARAAGEVAALLRDPPRRRGGR